MPIYLRAAIRIDRKRQERYQRTISRFFFDGGREHRKKWQCHFSEIALMVGRITQTRNRAAQLSLKKQLAAEVNLRNRPFDRRRGTRRSEVTECSCGC
jgi:hypothetical protein